jgi:hypothetical protein
VLAPVSRTISEKKASPFSVENGFFLMTPRGAGYAPSDQPFSSAPSLSLLPVSTGSRRGDPELKLHILPSHLTAKEKLPFKEEELRFSR